MNIKMNFHPASERPAKSGEYLVVPGNYVTVMNYSKEYDRWNAVDGCGCGHAVKISAWAKVPNGVKKLYNLPRKD